MKEKQKHEIKVEDLTMEICTALADCFVAQIVKEGEELCMKFPYGQNFMVKISKME